MIAATKRTPETKKRTRHPFDWAKLIFIMVMLFPALFHLAVFWFGVEVKTVIMAFTDYNTDAWCGFDNFAYIIKQFFGGGFTVFLRNTLLYFGIQLLLIPAGMLVSYLIYRKMIGATFVKYVLYLPCAISSILLSTIYIRLLSPDSYIGLFASWFGISDQLYVFETNHDLIYLMIYDIWVALGGNLFIWIGGMSRIPKDLFEVSALDGVPPRKEFAHIVLPLMWPTFETMVTVTVVGLFGAGGSNLLIGTGSDTYSISYWMYQMVLGGGVSDYNYASAAGLFFTVLTIPILIGQRLWMNHRGSVEEY